MNTSELQIIQTYVDAVESTLIHKMAASQKVSYTTMLRWIKTNEELRNYYKEVRNNILRSR